MIQRDLAEADFLDDDLIGALCRDGATAALPDDSVYRPLNQYFRMQQPQMARSLTSMLVGRVESAGCRVSRLDDR